MDYLQQHIESLIFAAESPISLKEIKQSLEGAFNTKFKETTLAEVLLAISAKYQEASFAFEVVEIANGYQFMTKGAYHQTVGQLLKIHSRKKLSRAALETLSIVAYKQPVSKSEIEKIRGVGCDYTIQKLLEKELVSIQGRSDGPGRPLLYGTSEKFMDYFGLKGLKDLPKLKDFKEPDTEIGEKAPIEEVRSGNAEVQNGEMEDLDTMRKRAMKEVVQSDKQSGDPQFEQLPPTDGQEEEE